MKKEKFDRERYIAHLSGDKRILQMQNYIQHGSVTTYDHVIRVARMSVKLNDFLHVNADEKTLIKGSFLHDYYLYDWHEYHGDHFHGFTHPKKAMELADQDFQLNDLERNMIRSHMWPLTLFHMPLHREAWLLCAADKISSTYETLFMRREKA